MRTLLCSRELRVWLVWLPAILGSMACRGVEVTYRGEPVSVVDMHLHTGSWAEMPESMQEILRESLPPPLNLAPELAVNRTLSAAGIASELERAGIDAGVLFAVYAPDTVGTASNALVLARVRQRSGLLYGLASIDVSAWREDAVAEASRLRSFLAEPEIIGIKLAHPHMGIMFDDPAFYPVYDVAAEYRVPVYVHTGNTPAPSALTDARATDPAFLEEAIATHPNTLFILGHAGYDFIQKTPRYLDACLRLAASYDNVLLEASALGSESSDPTGTGLPRVFAAIRAAGLVDRLIYGSDGPQRPGFLSDYLGRTLAVMDAADYSVAQARQVLSDNFTRVFGLPPIPHGLSSTCGPSCLLVP